jgi:hypothetical protein
MRLLNIDDILNFTTIKYELCSSKSFEILKLIDKRREEQPI